MSIQKKEDRRVRYTKAAIRSSFLSLLEEKPLDKISVTDICKMADINRGTFYSHYSDPYDLNSKLERQLVEVLEQQIRDLKTERLSTVQTLTLLKDNQELCRIFCGPYGDRVGMLKLVEQQADLFFKTHNNYISHLSPERIYYLRSLMISSIATAVKLWFDEGMLTPPQDVADIIDTYCTCGLDGFKKALY